MGAPPGHELATTEPHRGPLEVTVELTEKSDGVVFTGEIEVTVKIFDISCLLKMTFAAR